MTRNDSDTLSFETDPGAWEKLRNRLAWRYRWDITTQQPAKTSVSAVRRRAMLAEESAVSSTWAGVPPLRSRSSGLSSSRRKSNLSAAEIGDAHHTFLQMVELEQTGSVAGLQNEAQRLRIDGVLTPEEIAALDLKSIAAFWNSDLGRQFRSQASAVQRELAFTARFSPNELAPFTGDPPDSQLEQEYIVVQGIVDLAVILTGEIWLLDFKTDEMKDSEVADKVKLYQPQLSLYSKALSRAYKRPVSQCWLYFLSIRQSVALKPS